MSGRRSCRLALLLMMLILLFGSTAGGAADIPKIGFMYSLSRFTGPVPYQWVRIAADPIHQELLVLNTRNRSIDIYNRNGMEVFSIFLGRYDGTPRDVATDDDGRIYLLLSTVGSFNLKVLDYRGDHLGDIELSGMTEQFAGFRPDGVESHGPSLYLADLGKKMIVRVDLDGRFLDGFDIDRLLADVPAEEKADVILGDFSVDAQGRVLFTLPLLWRAGIIRPDGSIATFGRRGDAPGKFGIISGIAADANGLIYVSDTLRSVVLVFGEDLEFVTEFGGRGGGRHNLIGPSHLATDGERLCVSQLRNRGVSVFRSTRAP